MKGFWRHIAASASISAVFLICALALAVSAVPVNTPAVQASDGSLEVSLADSIIGLAEALDGAAANAPEQEAPAANTAVDTAAQPAPATAARARTEVPPPAAAEQPEEPVLQPESPNAQPAAPPAPPVLNPPKDLAGVFVADVPPYIELTWNPNNSPSVLDYCVIYREVVELPGQVSIFQSSKSTYDDYDIVLGYTYHYWVKAVSKDGRESGPSGTIEVSTQTMQPPAPPQGITAAALDPGVSFDWEANEESNLAGYNVYVSQNGRWRKLNNSSIITDNHYYYKQGVLGETYGVSAVNVFGLESSYTVVQPQPTTPVIYEETDPAVSVEGEAAIERYLGASGGSIIVFGKLGGEKLHFTFTGRQVKLIAAKYWSCGDARIYIDGELMATISLYSFDPVFQSIDVSVPGLKYGEHVLTVVAMGSGNPEGTYNFVNVDAFEVR